MNIDELIKELKELKKTGVERVVINGNKLELAKVSHEVANIIDTKEESL